MKEEKESEGGYSQIFLASPRPTENQSCAARFQKSFFSKLLNGGKAEWPISSR
jgi:hypothetical protein